MTRGEVAALPGLTRGFVELVPVLGRVLGVVFACTGGEPHLRTAAAAGGRAVAPALLDC